MTVLQATEKLKKVSNLFDFQDQFFSDFGDGEMTADFEIVYLTTGGYTDNSSAKIYDQNGYCTNSYMKLEDGYLPYPF